MRDPAARRVRIVFRAELTAHRGKLLSRRQKGAPVHAGTFLRQNLIVLDSALRKRPRELRRILTHEFAHFIWWRMGNPARFGYERLLAGEMRKKAPGELGWSAEMRKIELAARDIRGRTRRWREYCCESFCDSVAWLRCGGRHVEFTLPERWREARRRWLASIIEDKEFPCV